MTSVGTETTSQGSRMTSFSPSSPQNTAQRPDIDMNTSTVVCECSAAPLPGSAPT